MYKAPRNTPEQPSGSGNWMPHPTLDQIRILDDAAISLPRSKIEQYLVLQSDALNCSIVLILSICN
jgi:hypothetical protein